MAVLKNISAEELNTEFPVSSETNVFGRHEDCDIIVNALPISRRHFQILRVGSHYFIEDLQSRNGTILNGKPLHVKTMLFDGDRIEVSNLRFIFLTRDSLSEFSGSWGIRAEVIKVSKSMSSDGVDDDSVRRQTVDYGDIISSQELGSDPIDASCIQARIAVSDGGAAWPVTHESAKKLNHSLRLLHALRRTNRTEEVIARCLQFLFDAFPPAERISLVMRDESGDGVKVVAAVSRLPGQVVKICLPVVRTTMQTSEALLFMDHSRQQSSTIPELHTDAVRIVLAAPLAGLLGRSFAVLQMDTSNVKQPLTKHDLELLVILTHVMSAALEQAQDIESRVIKDVNHQLAIESERQRWLLESISAPTLSGFRFVHRRLGGRTSATEFVDYVRMADGRVACVFCDASTKVTGSECSVAFLFRMLAESLCTTHTAGEALSSVQDSIRLRRTTMNAELSVAVLVLNPETSRVSVAIAGDFRLNVISDNRLSSIDTTHCSRPPITGHKQPGSVDQLFTRTSSVKDHPQRELVLHEGDRLLVFSAAISSLDSATDTFLDSAGVRSLVLESKPEFSELFEARLSEHIVQNCKDMAVKNAIAFVSIQKHSSITAESAATTVTDAGCDMIERQDGIGNR